MGGVRLGVLGGTFDPIHFGHLHIARECRKLFSLSQVHFVVATTPPHKSPEDLVPFTHRYAMVCLATSGKPSFVPSMVELEPQASPFSVDTLGKLAQRIDGSRTALYFIAGGDSLPEVKSWRAGETLLKTYNFIFAVRPGTEKVDPGNVLPAQVLPRVRNLVGIDRTEVQRRIKEGEKSGENRIYIVDTGSPDISATQIRIRAGLGESIKYAVPVPVYDYIRKLNLYGDR